MNRIFDPIAWCLLRAVVVPRPSVAREVAP